MKFISFPTFHLNGERTGGYIIVELDVPPVLNSVEPKIKQILESHRMTITSVENATMVAEFDPTTHKQIGWVHNIKCYILPLSPITL
jgi:hypothetical protein